MMSQSLQHKEHRLILASQSPIRADILRKIGLIFETIPSRLDEAAIKAHHPSPQNTAHMAHNLAVAKARKISAAQKDAFIIGADQIMVCEGRLFDKPATMEDAQKNLTFLSGRQHELISAVCLVRNDELLWADIDKARLTMRDWDNKRDKEFLTTYLAQAGEAVLQSVGGYRLEGLGAHLFTHIEGDYFTILGLPLLPLLAALRKYELVQ